MRQQQFLDLATPADAQRRWRAALDLEPIEAQQLALSEALGRVLAQDLESPGDVPAFDRANVDGFAVSAADTFGASEREPVELELVGHAVGAGHAPTAVVRPGTAMAVATGGPLPRGADAMVMVEDTDADERHVWISRPATPSSSRKRQTRAA